MSDLTPERRERIQSRITKAILADESSEKVEQIVRANELSEEVANEIIQEARRVRVDTIRGVLMKKVWIGALIVSLGIGSIYGYLRITGTITNPIWILGLFVVGLGLITIIANVIGIIIAPSKKGSFANLD